MDKQKNWLRDIFQSNSEIVAFYRDTRAVQLFKSQIGIRRCGNYPHIRGFNTTFTNIKDDEHLHLRQRDGWIHVFSLNFSLFGAFFNYSN